MGNLISTFLPADLFDRTSNCVGEQAKYVWGLEKNLRVLETELHKLTRARADLKTKVEVEEQRPQTRRTNQVAGWLEDVQKLETEFTELERVRAQEMDRLCLGGLCSKNFVSSYNYGTQVVELTDRVINLKKDGEKIEVVVEKAPDGAAIELPLDHTVVGQELLVDRVWRCITDEEKNRAIIGLYGIGGIGKTTLLKQVNNNFCYQQHNFDVVIWAAASTLQDDIGKRIGFSEDKNWEKKSPQDKSVDIASILSRRTFVLLLDDIWERIDLTQLGVPLQKLNDGSKVVLTTRSAGVCDQMDAEKVEVYSLAHDKAWELFQEMVDRSTLDSHTSSHTSIPELAETLARECGGLPLALKTVGRAMKSQRKVGDWKRAIHKMTTSASKFSGMKEEVFSRLKFSYDCLSTDELRSCLLYCCLYPEDYEIPRRELIDYWISEGFVCDFDDGCDFIDDLLQACLLEEEGDDHVKMHDMIREMSLWIACTVDKEEQNFLVRAGVRLTEAPKVEEWKGAKRISLVANEIESLSEIPTCPRLVTLVLDGNRIEEITDGFFQSMSTLRVLSLSGNFGLSTLPSGISSLVSLHHLDLSWTNIRGLPQELKALEKLRYLNLDYAFNLSIIPPQLISGFSKLEVLRLRGCGRFGVIKGKEGNVLCDDAEPLMKELLGLKHLNVLSWSFRSSPAVQKFLKYPKLVSITQSVWVYQCESAPFNVLHLAYMESLQELDLEDMNLEEMKIDSTEEVKKLFQSGFRSLDRVVISSCKKMKDLTWLVFVQILKQLRIVFCTEMEEIISVDKLREISEIIGSEHNFFAQLESLTIKWGRNLKSVYPNPLPFPKLKKIEVLQCRQLKKLPLNSSSAKERRVVIEGSKEWWEELQWEDQATQNAFSSGAVLRDDFHLYV